jgi:hypothetical protein
MRPISSERGSRPEHPKNSNHGESAVATIWLALYALLLGAAIASPFVSNAIELAAR